MDDENDKNSNPSRRLHEIRTIQVLDLSPINESLRTCVNLLALNGRWEPFLPSALMHSFSASKLLLISAPSIPATQQTHINGRIIRKKWVNQRKNSAAYLFVDWKTACQHHVRYRLSRLMRIFRELYWLQDYGGLFEKRRANVMSYYWLRFDQKFCKVRGYKIHELVDGIANHRIGCTKTFD